MRASSVGSEVRVRDKINVGLKGAFLSQMARIKHKRGGRGKRMAVDAAGEAARLFVGAGWEGVRSLRYTAEAAS